MWVFDGGFCGWKVVGFEVVIDEVFLELGDVVFEEIGVDVLLIDEVVVFLEIGVLFDVCVLECYCGEMEFFDFVVGYIFGVCNFLFMLYFDVDGWIFDCEMVFGIFVVVGVMLGMFVVVYCGFGVMVVYMVFVLYEVGIEVKVFFGLWS